VNFDVVSREGEYLGGVLVPGVEISLDALTERGAKLPKIDLAPPRSVIGKSTVDAIRSGVVYGYAAAVDGILRRIRTELDEPGARTIATGGLAGHIVPFTEEIDEVDELLTLTGLRLVYERNAPA
jgi:type III pantothenate kinase